uniref:Predicted protein n=1 Tax=Hordeum vulgare subsp. vulgare TaxID=112509 RepID=F2E9M7_HORVV|nr:predicted protein [Hordeum vulgare subsp. vulgare]
MEMDSVVSLGYNSKFEGSGFVMFTSQPAFLVMTCEHVVGSYKSIQVTFPGKTKWYSAGVRWTDKDADLALLRFAPDGDCSRCAALQFADPNTTALNSGNVEMIAFHATSPGRLLYPGVFDGCITAEPEDGKITCNYASEHGTSGGPVLKRNKVVGVHKESLEVVKKAVSVVTVLDTLRKRHPNPGNSGIDEILRWHAN